MQLSPLRHFAPDLEREFRESYYKRVASSLRLAAPFVAALIFVGLQLSRTTPAPYDLTVALPQLAFWTIACALTWVRPFGRVWQPVLVTLALAMSALVLLRLAPALLNETASPVNSSGYVPTVPQQKFYFALQFVVLLVPLAMLRLQFGWSVLLYGGIFALGIWAFIRDLPVAPDTFLDLHYAFLPALIVLSVLLLTAFLQERLTRTAYWNAHQLEEERNAERRRREQTEGKLQVLSQAIGGIVHDLGNPLAAVQLGSQTLELFLDDDIPDKIMLEELNQTITDGARMLDFLRLSLIEQTRVLEGQPTPVNVKPVSLVSLVQSGIRFQKPYVVGTRSVHLSSGDVTLCADEMKMITVWMNLIGNAFKYSDGDVRIRWREQGSHVIVAVADRGTKGRGLSRVSAAKLFSAFGRLDDHSQIEGTGLGLLSVQKIMEAHGGEAWIEGFDDGTPNSAHFSTSPHYVGLPSMLQENDRTAFVVSCPLVTESSEPAQQETRAQRA